MANTKQRAHFPAIKRINEQITKLQAERNNLEIRAIQDGGYKDWPAMNAEYIKWERGQ